MPAAPASADPASADPASADPAAGIKHEALEGWTPALSSEADLRAAIEKAFDYRGDITVGLVDGTKFEGYCFDRDGESPSLHECTLRLILKAGGNKTIRYSDVQSLAFTGRDTAAGKSFETWIRKYNEKKAAGEKNIGLHPESLDDVPK